MRLRCINIAAPNDPTLYKLSTSFTSPEYGKRAVLEVLEDQLYRYRQQPEAKSLSSDGRPCDGAARGLLQRAHIVAGKHRRIGKESDRRWEEAAELESLSYVPIEFEPPGIEQKRNELARASESQIRKIKRIGIRELIRSGFGRRILEKICRRQPVSVDTLREYEQRIRLSGLL